MRGINAEEGDAQVDKDAFAICCRWSRRPRSPLQSEQRRQDRDERVGIDGVENYLEDGVEGHQTAQYSVSPLARSFQTITMAMQRASPIMIKTDHVLGRAAPSKMASRNMSIGPIIQF